MSRFWNRRAAGLSPYVPGEQPQIAGLIKLNTNEHPLAPSPEAMAVLSGIKGELLRRYPDPAAQALRDAIAEAEGVAPDCVFAGNGSDDVLAHAFLGLLDPAIPVTVPAITYSFYPVWAQLCEVPLQRVPLTDAFTLDLAKLNESEGPILLANPNAPTGLAITREEIAGLAGSNRDRLVIVDEAYFGFGAESAAPLVHEFDNVLVTRTLSKSHALAGLRVGYAIGASELIEGLVRVKDSFNSYPIDAIAQQVATAAIQDQDWFAAASKQVADWRDELAETLTAMGFRVLPSSANFLFVEHATHSGASVFDALRDARVLVRRWDKPGIDNWLRITVGNEAENAALVAALAEILSR